MKGGGQSEHERVCTTVRMLTVGPERALWMVWMVWIVCCGAGSLKYEQEGKRQCVCVCVCVLVTQVLVRSR